MTRTFKHSKYATHRRHPSAGNLSKISCSFFYFPKKTAATAKPPGHSADNTAREPVFAPSPRQLSPFGDWRSCPLKAQNTRKIKLSRSFPSPWGDARGVLVPGGHRPGPTEAAAETCPLEKLYIILKIEIPLPCQRGPLFQKSIGAGGGRGWVTPKPAKSPSLQESSYFPPEAGGARGAKPRLVGGGAGECSPLREDTKG